MNERVVPCGWNEEGEPLLWPAVWQICSRCRGDGTTVNPAIDGNGISTSDECWQDDDFRDNYMSGVYDVACATCHGTGKVLVPDEHLIAYDPEQYALYVACREDEAEMRAEMRSEQRWGY